MFKNIIKYIVKPEEKIVVGIVERPSTMPWATRNILNGDERWLLSGTELWCGDSRKDKAVARCTGEDTFDETIGKRIVELKLNYKWHIRVAKSLLRCADKLLELSERLTNESDKYIALAKECAGKLDTFNENGDPDELR